MIPDPYRATIREIAGALQVPDRTAQHQAKVGGWPYDEDTLPTGAKRRLYPLATLPKAVWDAVLLHRSGATPPAVAPDPEYRPSAAEVYQREVQGMDPAAQRRMDAKLEILAAYQTFIRGKEVGRNESLRAFAELFNRRLVPVPAWVTDTVGHICRNSLINWQRDHAAGRLRDLGGRYGRRRKGTGVFDQHAELAQFVIGFVTMNPTKTIGTCYRAAHGRFGDTLTLPDGKTAALPARRGFERFVEGWKRDNPALWSRATNPDQYRSKFEPAPGEMYKDIVRRNQLWEIDASPADVMCTDGRHSIYVVVDVHSRWPRARVTKTPKTAAALLLIRDCIIGWPGRPETAWGVADTLRTDNGSDFTSVHFKDTVRRIGMEQDICDPYSPKQKACVERTIGTVQRQFMELQPGFVGHNVSERRQIETRKAFAERLGEDDKNAFCVELTAAELQQRLTDWIEKVYVHQPHEGLGGKTPFEVRSAYRGRIAKVEGDGVLEMLLAAPADGDGMRVVGPKGLRVGGIHYLHAELMPGEQVHVRLDPDDIGKVYVYRDDPWEFLCIAVNPEREGVSRAEVAAKIKAQHKAVMAEGMKDIRKAQKSINMASVSLEVTARAEERTGALTAFPAPSDTHTTPDLTAAAQAAQARTRKAPEASPVSAAEQARIDALAAEMAQPKAEVIRLSPKASQFKRAWEIEERLGRGEVVDERDRAWLSQFQNHPTYLALKPIALEHGLASVLTM